MSARQGGCRRTIEDAARLAAPALYAGLGLLLYLAPPPAQALDWDHLWLNADQRAARKMHDKDYASAARTFKDKRWQAAAWYRAGRYKRSAEAWGRMDDTDAHYNRGNALARLGDLEGAAKEYKTVLKRDPGNKDARHNLEVVEKMMQHSNKSGSQGRQKQQKEAGQNGQKDKNGSGRQAGDKDQQAAGGQRSDRSGKDNGQQGSKSASSSDRPQNSAERSASADGERRRKSTPDQTRGRTKDLSNEQAKGRAKGQDRGQEAGRKDQSAAARDVSPESQTPEQQAAMEQWLRRIPDDPGGLLRRKFRYQYQQRRRDEQQEENPW